MLLAFTSASKGIVLRGLAKLNVKAGQSLLSHMTNRKEDETMKLTRKSPRTAGTSIF